MKKLLGIVVLGLLCCNISQANIIELKKRVPTREKDDGVIATFNFANRPGTSID